MKPHGLKPIARAWRAPDLTVDASRAHQREMDAEIATEQLESGDIEIACAMGCPPWCKSCDDPFDGLGPLTFEVTAFEESIRRDHLPRVGDVVRERFEFLVRQPSWHVVARFDAPDADVDDAGALLLDWTLPGVRFRIRCDVTDDDSGWSFATSIELGGLALNGSLATVGQGVALLMEHAPKG